MAYIGQVSIRDDSHMENAIHYIAKEEKALNLETFKSELNHRLEHLHNINTAIGERISCINCSATQTYKEFENMRKAFGQDKGVIAHHYFQSFQKDDEVTPELAHQIGVELARKMFPDFQVVVATHTDREHLHNHIIVNSCNILTGQKWYSNKKSLSDIRKESDKLCLKNGLSIIDTKSKYKGIDRTTYQLGLQGKSWKIQLVKDLEQAAKYCHSKDEFIRFLTERDYTVRYKDIHITITKNGEKKGIRVDTLAKQFGEKFTKENLEKTMGYYQPPSAEIVEQYKSEPKHSDTSEAKSNWEYYEQFVFKKTKCLPSVSGKIVRKKETESMFKKMESVTPEKKTGLYRILFFVLIALSSFNGHQKKKKYKIVKQTIPESKPDTIRQVRPYIPYGNISYKKMTESAGENFTVKVSMERLLLLINQPILYAASINRQTGTATITIKEKDKDFLAELLNLMEYKGRLVEQNEKLSNQVMYQKLKEAAQAENQKLTYLIVNHEQIQKLKEHYIDFAYFEKEDGKYNIAFLPEKTELIKSLIYPKKKVETEQQRNARIYAGLKKAAAESGQKLQYRTKLTAEQLKVLESLSFPVAHFRNSEDKSLYNIAFEKKNEEAVKAALSGTELKQKL